MYLEAELRELEEMKLKSVLELYSSWEAWKETFFQKIITYHLPPTSSLLLSKDLSSLTVIVTGSTNGIGLHIARELAKAGAHVVMACRNTILAEKVASSWREKTRSNGELVNIDVMELDLSSFASVRKFAKEWEKLDLALDLLINNAGILQVEDEQKFTRDGIEQHIHVNHVAPALLTLLLLPSLSKARSSRIINVNSVAHYVGVVEPQYWNSRDEEEKYTSLRAYGSSKLAQIMFLKVLGNKLLELNKTTIQSIAVHPGAVCSNLNSQQRKKHYFMFDADQGARSALFCATSDSVADNLVKGFAYYSVRCKPGKISSKAEDMGACLDVWQKTIELLDLGNDYLSRIFDGTLI